MCCISITKIRLLKYTCCMTFVIFIVSYYSWSCDKRWKVAVFVATFAATHSQQNFAEKNIKGSRLVFICPLQNMFCGNLLVGIIIFQRVFWLWMYQAIPMNKYLKKMNNTIWYNMYFDTFQTVLVSEWRFYPFTPIWDWQCFKFTLMWRILQKYTLIFSFRSQWRYKNGRIFGKVSKG